MEQTTFTYEAREQMLVIHLPGELDHHNCRNLKRTCFWRRITSIGLYLILHTHHLWIHPASGYF
mgnify:CR=1 FL=1